MNFTPNFVERNSDDIIAIDIDSFLSLKIPPRKCLLGPWLPSSGLTQVYAYRGVGKTFFALNVAYAVATGKSFLGWHSPCPKRVLYIDGEMPAADMQSRIRTVRGSDGIEPNNFKLITPDFQKFETPNLATQEGQKKLEKFTSQADLIIVDNISTLCRTGKENDSDHWAPVQRWALDMRSQGRSVLFVHHSNKSGGQRGTSSREDVLDTVISLKKPTGSSPTEGATFEVHFEKNRGFSGEDAKAFSASLSIENGRQKWKREELSESTFHRSVTLAKSGLTCAEISRQLDLNKSTISRHLSKAKDQGLISTSSA